MNYVSTDEMARFKRAMDLQGYNGAKEFLREYFASPKMRFWDEHRALRIERIEQVRPGAAQEFEAFLADYVQRNNVRWQNQVQGLISLLQEEKTKVPLVYNNPLLNDRGFQKFLKKYAEALGASKIDGTMEEDEPRIKVAQEAWQKLTAQREETLRFFENGLKSVTVLSADDLEAIYAHVENEVASKPSRVAEVLKKYKELVGSLAERIRYVEQRDECRFFDKNRDQLERKKHLLELVIQSEKGIIGKLQIGKRKRADAIAELETSFFVKIPDREGAQYQAAVELSKFCIYVESPLRHKDEALAKLDELRKKPVD